MNSEQIKEYLFDYIKKSENRIDDLILRHKHSEIIDDIIANCYDKVLSFGQKDVVLGIFATGILHYLLTRTLVSSQRKVAWNEVEIDVIIPDLKTLEKHPEKSLIIFILYNMEEKDIKENLKQLQEIQPINENIWLVSSKYLSFDNKTYVISKSGSFSRIIDDIIRFVTIHTQNKFKILRT